MFVKKYRLTKSISTTKNIGTRLTKSIGPQKHKHSHQNYKKQAAGTLPTALDTFINLSYDSQTWCIAEAKLIPLFREHHFFALQ